LIEYNTFFINIYNYDKNHETNSKIILENTINEYKQIESFLSNNNININKKEKKKENFKRQI